MNASHHYFPRNESMKENETIQGEITNEQEGSSEINIANETTESANISVVINSSFVSTAEVFVDTKTSSPLLLSSCEYVDLTVLKASADLDLLQTSPTFHKIFTRRFSLTLVRVTPF